MRTIKYIVAHCTATPQNTTVESIKNYWKNNLKWKNVGYHYLIDKDGEVHQLSDESQPTNGVKGFNQVSIHVSYIGGQKVDDRTDLQKASMLGLMKHLRDKYPNAIIQGHRDFPNVAKACPRFNAKDEFNF